MADFDEHAQFDDAEQSFESQYDMQDKVLLGEGTYGKVYKVRCVRTGESVAIKQMKLDAQEEGVPSTAIREVALLKELQHPNIVRLLDVHCKEPNKLVLVFEFLENDLKKHMKAQSGRLSPGTVKNLGYQLCRGIEFCHANRIIHRDLKPQNLLIDRRLALLKIADFGLARAFTVPVPKYTHEVVTVWYRPPEILLGSPLYSVPVDLWSIGCVLAEMATGAPLFAGDSEIDTVFKIFQKLGTPNEQVWPGVNELPDFKASFPKWPHRGWANIRNTLQQVGQEGIDLLESLMCYDPRRRISARRALQHHYFCEVDASRLD
jgi:serine/threonine protein kinase